MLSYNLKTASVNVMMNPIILLGKFHIHKSKMNNSKPCLKFIFYFFWSDFQLYIESLYR